MEPSQSKELIARSIAIARGIRNAIYQVLVHEAGSPLHTQLQEFRQALLPGLTPEQVADMYAQTICSGLFAARYNARPDTPFTRQSAAYHIPQGDPCLRKLFEHIAGPDLDERIAGAVDELVDVLAGYDMPGMGEEAGKGSQHKGTIAHFYEAFLAEYDPQARGIRGVYYTPQPVVSYIVHSVDHLLKKSFGLPEGLADASMIQTMSPGSEDSVESHKVQVLDPATGTGSFLQAVIDLIYESFRGNKDLWSSYVSQHLLTRLSGFELLLAPYAVAHLGLALQLASTGYDFKGDERLGLYLANALEQGLEKHISFGDWIKAGEHRAGSNGGKHEAPLMVIMGNPPYYGHSVNKGKWITELLHDKRGSYFEVDGQPLAERNSKWLNDDYVKFICFGQWCIEQAGHGILAFVTNHAYLDNPTFRGMRQSLLRSFDEIYILDLHGNSKKKERSPDGSKDENVFDIQQGVAIGIFVKRQGKNDAQAAVYHADVWGPRQVYQETSQEQQLVAGKYHWLAEHDVSNTPWTRIIPERPLYLFVPRCAHVRAEYEQGWRITHLMPVYSLGVLTKRDALAIGFTPGETLQNIRVFVDCELSDEECAAYFRIPLRDKDRWDLAKARANVRHDVRPEAIVPILYRPFDWRYVYYDETPVARLNRRVMQHLAQENVAMILGRQGQATGSSTWDVLFASASLVDQNIYRRGGGTVFPLYLYKDASTDAGPSYIPHCNLSPAFIKDIVTRLNLQFVPRGRGDLQATFGPEDVFNYMYAIFHSPGYCERYAEFLASDFPRLLLTSHAGLFRELCGLGSRLVGLHLLKKSGPITTSYPVPGSNIVEKVRHVQPAGSDAYGRVYINKTQYVEGVPPEAWEFHIGGYQVCQKWLKDRKGRALSVEDIKHYQRIVAVLVETINLRARIDEVIEQYGGWPVL